MKDIVIEIIRQITAEKKKALKVPDFALKVEILSRVWKKADEALTEIAKSDKVSIGRTINNTHYRVRNINENIDISRILKMSIDEIAELNYSGFDGLKPKEVLDSFVFAINKNNEIQMNDKKIIRTYISLISGNHLDKWTKTALYDRLMKPTFQYKFTSIVSVIILALSQIEAYEMLENIRLINQAMSKNEHLKYFDFWELLPLEQKKLSS